ncbi:hypothetical protein V8C86DRAFT_1045021 [Haematococcus lacustris]
MNDCIDLLHAIASLSADGLFPEPVAALVDSYSRTLNMMTMMPALPLLSLVSTLLGCSASISPNSSSTERVTPCLWLVIAAPPGSGKTPAMAFVVKSMSLLQHGIASGQEMAGVPEPRRATFLAGTKTTEGLLDELYHSTTRSLLLMADELTTLINSFGRYGTTPAAASGDQSTMLSVASGARMVLGTKGGGKQVLEEGGYNMCILAGSQVPVMQGAIFNQSAFANGMAFRFLTAVCKPLPDAFTTTADAEMEALQVSATIVQRWSNIADGQRVSAITPGSSEPPGKQACRSGSSSASATPVPAGRASISDAYSSECKGLLMGLLREHAVSDPPSSLATTLAPPTAVMAQLLYDLVSIFYKSDVSPRDRRFLFDEQSGEGPSAAQQFAALCQIARSVGDAHHRNDVVAAACAKYPVLIMKMSLVLHGMNFVLCYPELPEGTPPMPCMIDGDILTYAYNIVGLLMVPMMVLSSNDCANFLAMWPLVPNQVRNMAMRFLKMRQGPTATHVRSVQTMSADDWETDTDMLHYPAKRQAVEQARPSGGASSRQGAFARLAGLTVNINNPSQRDLEICASAHALPPAHEDILKCFAVHFANISGSGSAVETLVQKAPVLLKKGQYHNKSGKPAFDSKFALFTVPIALVQSVYA